jgi:hypothetical protein
MTAVATRAVGASNVPEGRRTDRDRVGRNHVPSDWSYTTPWNVTPTSPHHGSRPSKVCLHCLRTTSRKPCTSLVPRGQYADRLQLFGQFVGSWQLAWSGTGADAGPPA